jgi:hypothetical protein
VENGEGIFATVGEMWEPHPGVVVTSEALQKTPEPRKSGEESHYPGVGGVALSRMDPVIGI